MLNLIHDIVLYIFLACFGLLTIALILIGLGGDPARHLVRGWLGL